MSKLDAYRDLIKSAIARNKEAFIPNSGKEHATIMMAAMLLSAKEEVLMTVGSFSGHVSDETEYIEALQQCLARDVRFSVLILESPNLGSKALALLRYYQRINPKQVRIYVGTELTSQMTENHKMHFTVFDQKLARLEIKPGAFEAIGVVNQSSMAKSLAQTHMELIANAKPYATEAA